MTTAEIEKLEAGENLDAIIAREIFGHKRIGYSAPKPGISKWMHIDSELYPTEQEAEQAYREYHERVHGKLARGYIDPDDYGTSLCYWKDGYGPLAVSEYSQWLWDAMELVDIWEGDFELRRQNGQYRATFYNPSEEDEAWAETAALAICRARLRAANRHGGVL